MTDLNTKQSALNSKIWQIVKKVRGNSFGWEFKQYLIGILFYRFLSEKLVKFVNVKQNKSQNCNFNYATLVDRGCRAVS